MPCQCCAVAEYDEFHTCSCDGDIHSPKVAQETYLALVVCADERDEYDVAFLALETIYGVDGDEMSERFEKSLLSHHSPEVLHLCTVG